MTDSSATFKSYDLYNPTEEHKMLRQTLREFVKKEVEPQALAHDRAEKFNLTLFRKLGDMGLLGLTVDPDHGGSGQDALAAVLVHEELSYSDPGFCLAYLAHSMLFVNNFAHAASEEQKTRILPKVCSGEFVGCMAMSEPNYGTDVLGMETTATRQGERYILNGQKMWITNGCVDDQGTPADVVLVYAKTSRENGKAQVSSFLVERSHPGFRVGQKIKDKTGMRASNTAELVFDNCKVPVANLLGKEGDSMMHMMRNLEIERVTLAAMSLGIARRCLDVMIKYAMDRKAFGQSLSHFGQIQKYIADSYAEYMAAKAFTYETARRLNIDKEGQRIDSDGVKLVASTMGKNVADRAIQVLGGYGYVSEYVVERLWRDSKLLEIGGGTIEAHQKNITRDLCRHFQELP
jgi:isovaleryl-CoA dehydrogenase